MSAPVIDLEAIEKSFHEVPVLRGIDLSLAPGETLTILGGSGSGKSVCLKHMIGLLRPDRGRVRVDGQDVTELSESGWVELRRDFGFVFQGAALFDSIDVYENVAYPIREHLDLPEPDVRERVARSLDSVGLAGVERLMPAELSGGMRKRVGVARAIALEPRVILYDEPTTGLDPANSRRIGKLIRKLQRELQATSVVVTHDMELCFEVSDRVALLRDGVIVLEGDASVLEDRSAPELRTFLEGSEPLPPAWSDPNRAGGDANQGDPHDG